MELLAPAGSIAALLSAVNAGADAVYFGLSEHNARIKSQDFNTDNLPEWVDYCHLYGVKAYITLNTSVKDSEIPRIKELIKAIDNCGADAVIAADIAVIKLIKEIAPLLAIHVSTQAGVHNLLGARFYEKLGAKRVVLAREIAEQDVLDIINNTSLEVERFAHGALCVAFSGGCLLSSVLGGMSGNRGRCMQPCRKEYTAYDDNRKIIDEGYLLSTSDLALREKIFDYEAQGVKCIKIEGRLKRPEYVGVVTDYYRKLLDGFKPSDIGLKKIFVRGNFIDSYGNAHGAIYKETPNHIGINIGKIAFTEKRGGFIFAGINSNHPIQKGDGLKLLRDGKEIGGADVTSVERRGELYIVPVSSGAVSGDEVRLTTDSIQLAEISKLKKRIGIKIKFFISADGFPRITAISDNAEAEFIVETKAEAGILTDNQIKSQLEKVNDTPFEIISIELENNGGRLAKSVLNGMRREVLKSLEKAIVAAYRRNESVLTDSSNIIKKLHRKKGARIVEVQNKEQLINLTADAVIINPIEFNIVNILEIVACAVQSSNNLFVKMPRINRNGAFDTIMEAVRFYRLGILADNAYAVEYARENGIPYIAGTGLNIYNSIAFDYYSDAEYIMPSPEIGVALCENGGVIFSLGRLPLMTLTHCSFSVLYNSKCVCDKKGGLVNYKSGKEAFPIIPTVGKICIFTLYNGVPHNLLSKIDGMGYNNYISLVTFDTLEQLISEKGTAGHFNNEVI